jgi:hypothetical protein
VGDSGGDVNGGGDTGGGDAGGGDTGGGDTGGGDTGGGGDCVTSLGVGADPIFEQTGSRIVVQPNPTWYDLKGALFDEPTVEFHEEAERSGLCRLLTYDGGSCGAPCEGGSFCAGGECVTPPDSVSAGTLTITGVTAAPIVVEPDSSGNYWASVEAVIALGDRVRAVTAGAEVPAFDVEACPVTAPEAIGEWSELLGARAPGEDVTLTWSNPDPGARIYLRMTTGIGTHGGISPVEVECEGPDTGSLTLPGAYLDALYAEGWSCGECGDNRLFRYATGEVEAGGITVQLRVQGAQGFWFHPNF